MLRWTCSISGVGARSSHSPFSKVVCSRLNSAFQIFPTTRFSFALVAWKVSRPSPATIRSVAPSPHVVPNSASWSRAAPIRSRNAVVSANSRLSCALIHAASPSAMAEDSDARSRILEPSCASATHPVPPILPAARRAFALVVTSGSITRRHTAHAPTDAIRTV